MYLIVREAAQDTNTAGLQHCDIPHRMDLCAGATESVVADAGVDERGRDDGYGLRAVCTVRSWAGD